MIRSIIVVILGMSYAWPVYSLSWTNCTNEQEKITRTETEVWGTNSVEWKKSDRKIHHAKEFFDHTTRKNLATESITDASFGKGLKETYQINVVVKEPIEKVAIEGQVTCSKFNYPHIYD